MTDDEKDKLYKEHPELALYGAWLNSLSSDDYDDYTNALRKWEKGKIEAYHSKFQFFVKTSNPN